LRIQVKGVLDIQIDLFEVPAGCGCVLLGKGRIFRKRDIACDFTNLPVGKVAGVRPMMNDL
jgi:hypothetical protein